MIGCMPKHFLSQDGLHQVGDRGGSNK